MSVYKKLQDARIKLQGTALSKSGLNKFAGFAYFELGDFLPSIQSIFADVGLSSTINFTSDMATLKIVDTEDGSFDTFTCPVVVPTMKGCNEVQALGAMITYIRRYLYVNALEIVEHDAMDAVVGKDEKQSKSVAQTFDAEIAAIHGAKTLADLVNVWKKLDPKAKYVLEAEKDAAKAKLEEVKE